MSFYSTVNKLERKEEHWAFMLLNVHSYRFAVQHSNNLFEVSSVCLGAFSESCDKRTCNLMKHCSVVDASCSTENSLEEIFCRVHLVCTHHNFHVTPHMVI